MWAGAARAVVGAVGVGRARRALVGGVRNRRLSLFRFGDEAEGGVAGEGEFGSGGETEGGAEPEVAEEFGLEAVEPDDGADFAVGEAGDELGVVGRGGFGADGVEGERAAELVGAGDDGAGVVEFGFGHEEVGVLGEKDGVAFGGAAFDPVGDEVEFFLSEAEVALKFAEAFDGAPRRHAAGEDLFLYGGGPGAGGFVGHQGEGRGAAIAVAIGAVFVEEADDFLGEGELGGDGVVGAGGGGAEAEGEGEAGHFVVSEPFCLNSSSRERRAS